MLVFCTDPPEGIRATPLDRDWSHWQASITGPTNSPYEGGVFYLHVQIPDRLVVELLSLIARVELTADCYC